LNTDKTISVSDLYVSQAQVKAHLQAAQAKLRPKLAKELSPFPR
jgi:hypothetical protein